MIDTVFLTSSLDTYDFAADGNKQSKPICNHNGIVDQFRLHIQQRSRFLYIASCADNYEITDAYYRITASAFEQTIPFCGYDLLDGRTCKHARSLVKQADVIVLSGGHVPTQRLFFNQIGLKALLQDAHAVVIGISAGSMNAAQRAYCPPEIEGEGKDPGFVRYFDGLGLTNLNIFPHYEQVRFQTVDGLENERDFILPDSYHSPIIAFDDHTYVLQRNGAATVYGEAYRFENGVRTKICSDGQCTRI